MTKKITRKKEKNIGLTHLTTWETIIVFHIHARQKESRAQLSVRTTHECGVASKEAGIMILCSELMKWEPLNRFV